MASAAPFQTFQTCKAKGHLNLNLLTEKAGDWDLSLCALIVGAQHP